jgi:hypothetical protein
MAMFGACGRCDKKKECSITARGVFHGMVHEAGQQAAAPQANCESGLRVAVICPTNFKVVFYRRSTADPGPSWRRYKNRRAIYGGTRSRSALKRARPNSME